MSRALVALALALALGGPPLQWVAGLVEVMLSATQDSGIQEDPNGGQSNSDYGSHWDPDG